MSKKKEEMTMTLETFLNHFFLNEAKKLYYMKHWGKDLTLEKTFKEWEEVTGLTL